MHGTVLVACLSCGCLGAMCAPPHCSERTGPESKAVWRGSGGQGPTSCPVTRMTVLLQPGSRGARRCAASAHQPAAVACAAAPCHWTLAALLLQHHRGCSRQPGKPTMRAEAGALGAAAAYGHNSDGRPAGALLAAGCRLPLMAAPANEQGCKAYLYASCKCEQGGGRRRAAGGRRTGRPPEARALPRMWAIQTVGAALPRLPACYTALCCARGSLGLEQGPLGPQSTPQACPRVLEQAAALSSRPLRTRRPARLPRGAATSRWLTSSCKSHWAAIKARPQPGRTSTTAPAKFGYLQHKWTKCCSSCGPGVIQLWHPMWRACSRKRCAGWGGATRVALGGQRERSPAPACPSAHREDAGMRGGGAPQPPAIHF